MTMKQTILDNVDTYFLIEDAQRILPTHSSHSVRGRINEMIKDGQITRARKVSGNKRAIYSKVNPA